jgi:hypothetical protein
LRFQTQEKFANIWQVLTIQTVTPIGLCYLTFVCENKQGKHYNWSESFKEGSSQKSSALSILFEGGETLAVFDPTDIVAKKPQPLQGAAVFLGKYTRNRKNNTAQLKIIRFY